MMWGEPIEPKRPVSIDDEGVVIVGLYLGATGFEQHDAAGKPRKSKIHSVKVREGFRFLPLPMGGFHEGDEFRFWGSYDLDDKLRRVPGGALVRIAYQHSDKLSGGRTMKVFEVRMASGREQVKENQEVDGPPSWTDERNPPPEPEPLS